MVLPTSNEDGRVGENELLALKEQTHNIPLVIIKGVTGKFRGYEHPVSQLYQDKALRKGVIENHYVVEGAKRIHIKHVPAHCPGIHIPQVSLLLPSPMRASALLHSRVSPLFTSLSLSLSLSLYVQASIWRLNPACCRRSRHGETRVADNVTVAHGSGVWMTVSVCLCVFVRVLRTAVVSG